VKETGLTPHERELRQGVIRRGPAIREVVLYGSRTKGSFRPESDIDLALLGIEVEMQAAAIVEELEELPLPYRFDVNVRSVITHPPVE